MWVTSPPALPTLMYLSSFQTPTPTLINPYNNNNNNKNNPYKQPLQLSFSLQHHYYNNNNNNNRDDDDDDDEEEHVVVIGDCLVFEQDAFDDPSVYPTTPSPSSPSTSVLVKNKKPMVEIKPEDLVPEKWKDMVEAINITKKERRKMAREMEFGRRVEKRLQGLAPIRNVSIEDYVAHRDAKLAQLSPIVLERPSELRIEGEGKRKEGDDVVRSERVAPRNPRMAVYGGSLDDITEFFNSGVYDPTAAKKTEARRKLFTKEEKVQLNKRIPELADASCDKWLPLHTLVASGEFYLMDALLKHNVDINAKDKDGLTALHKATFSKKQAIFNYLLRESANPFVCDDEGATLMHYAVRAASSQMIKILILYNVDINVKDNDGWTPLHLAVQTRRTDIVRLLLIKGADTTLKNMDGLTPLDLCLYLGRDTRTYELIKLLKLPPKPRQLL